MMKKLKKIVAFSLLTGSLFLVSCGENKNNVPEESMDHEIPEGEHMQHDISEENHNHHNGEITAKFQDKRVAVLYEHYSNIKTALVSSQSEMAKNSAKEFLAVAASSKSGSNMATAAQNIAGSSDVQEQRQAFSQLTKAIEGQLRGAIVSGTIYKQYCPMAFEGKGDFWFANSKEIRNPYYGEKMLNCGRVEETLK